MQEGAKQWLANLKAVPSLSKGVVASTRSSVADLRKDWRGMLAPKTRFQTKITTHRVWDFVRFEMKDVQALRAALGKPKMNDLLLTVVGGALRKYLTKHRELPERSLLTICPISVRGAGDPGEGGNFVSGMRVPLGTDIADPIARLAAIGEASKLGKEQAEAIGGDFMGNMLAMTPCARG